MWSPLAGTEFANDCFGVSSRRELAAHLLEHYAAYDVVIAIKPLPDSFGVVLESLAGKAPIILDIDDPDIEAHARGPFIGYQFLASLRHPVYRRRLRRLVKRLDEFPHTVSNPVLQSRYGGDIIPHVRPKSVTLKAERSTGNGETLPRIAFIGTPHRHKGVGLLRDAVADINGEGVGFRLVITANAPEDRKPWEEWVGQTSLEEGLQLLADADIVLLPSLDGPRASGQLPVKLIDSMMAGRAIGVSNVEPMPWAVGSGGIVFEPGSRDVIKDTLKQLEDANLRQELGRRAQDRAYQLFTVEAVSGLFDRSVRRALLAQEQETAR
ncbi:hypothetical protein GCM10009740_08500 [Terrabacter terrae]|uniref:Glycosyltransferase n=1 Tax=Terrabacter terrae TaxID=318434 RepID=A0ABN2TVC9_9MICO